MNLNVLRFGFLGNEDVGEDDGNDQKDNDDYHTLLQPSLGFPHPFDTLIFLFLGATYFAFRVMMMLRHLNNGKWKMENG